MNFTRVTLLSSAADTLNSVLDLCWHRCDPTCSSCSSVVVILFTLELLVDLYLSMEGYKFLVSNSKFADRVVQVIWLLPIRSLGQIDLDVCNFTTASR